MATRNALFTGPPIDEDILDIGVSSNACIAIPALATTFTIGGTLAGGIAPTAMEWVVIASGGGTAISDYGPVYDDRHLAGVFRVPTLLVNGGTPNNLLVRNWDATYELSATIEWYD
jgi:hypothetical protein